VTILTGTRTVAPMAVATGGVDESVEGRLVSVSGTLTREIVDDAPYGLKVYIDDGSGEVQVFVHLVGGVGVVDTAGLTLGSSIAVVGLAAQYESTYEVAPRVAADLIRR
jgi:DNA/RNA endonuclease YhcR with UshA esterase domain